MSDLQRIETAPKDGTLVLLYWADPLQSPWESEGGYCVGFWSDPGVGDTEPEDAGWYATDTSNNPFQYPPTHWMPLPDRPPKMVVGTLTYRIGAEVIEQQIPIVDNGRNTLVKSTGTPIKTVHCPSCGGWFTFVEDV